ncbi:cysteine hydrolase [Nocardioides sp. JQ2195]|uniref:cysteine hydrolase family protein n=1 Tax=Nocardioides sp. JQ2195 TaxID=2592334 RepID=UPI00143E99FA|nr:isochorismatase family cysteine hydrolase [Nocardioides sp. JQ2195]QIX27110.1 cysteine hydrolase [Nocardioides sp. JQ2195]
MNGSTPALVLIDMQVAFFASGPLESRTNALVEQCNALQRWAFEQEMPVIRVRTEHLPDRSTWTLSMLEDDQGFLIAGDDDAQLVDGLAVDGGTEVVKTRDSAFHHTGFSDLLRERDVDLLVLSGVSTHTCVAATAGDAYAHNLHVVFAEDAIASHRPELHRPTLEVMCEEFRFRSLSTAEITDGSGPDLTARPV